MKTIQLKPSDYDYGNTSAEGAMKGARRAPEIEASAEGSGSKPSGPTVPNPEVPEKTPRRKHTAKYKLRILEEADACTELGQIGALLRREGLYSSNLTTWRRQREKGLLQALTPQKRGRKETGKNPLAPKVAELEKEIAYLRKKLKKAETIIDVQKKISEVLGISQEPTEDERGIS